MSAGERCRNEHLVDELGRNGRGECVACTREQRRRYSSSDKGRAAQARYSVTAGRRASKAAYRARLRGAAA